MAASQGCQFTPAQTTEDGEQHQGADVLRDEHVQVIQDLFGDRAPPGIDAVDDGVSHRAAVLDEEETEDRNEHQRHQVSDSSEDAGPDFPEHGQYFIPDSDGLIPQKVRESGTPCFEPRRQGYPAQQIFLERVRKTAGQRGSLLADLCSDRNQDGQGDAD